MFAKILIANRGEIACRVIRTAREMGIATVAVYSDADAGAPHVRMADEAVRLGPPTARDSYLKGEAVIGAARATGVQAIHPGYGFLSENAGFARACAEAGLVFIGPSPDAIDAMGLKDRAKAIMEKAGVPVVPGYQGDDQSPENLHRQADSVGYPLLIKAVAGGGGKGMRRVERSEEFAAALEACQREAANAFGNAQVLLEKYIAQPRHVEVQVFGDVHGNVVHLFERDCSVQRRHQKIIEEAPAPGLPDAVRKALGDTAVRAAQAIGYTNAGTIEFIMDAVMHDFYFMEMNTRLQVEHPVTEMITGLDLVEWQLRVAAGETLPLSQAEITCDGHAFEVRLYAEDPAQDFLPQTGRIDYFLEPATARVERGVQAGDTITIFYDPMIAKIIAQGPTREAALQALENSLARGLAVAGLRTNQEFLCGLLTHPEFKAGNVDTGFITRHEAELLPADYGCPRPADLALAVICSMSGDDAFDRGPWRADGWRGGGTTTRRFAFAHRGGASTLTATRLGNKISMDIGDAAHQIEIGMHIDDKITLMLDGAPVEGIVVRHGDALSVFCGGRAVVLRRPRRAITAASAGRVVAPMPGRIVALVAAAGDPIEKDKPLLVMEAMKMEITIRAPAAGTVESLNVRAGDQVADGALLAVIAA